MWKLRRTILVPVFALCCELFLPIQEFMILKYNNNYCKFYLTDHSVSSPRTHCNICGRNNHDNSNCRAKYDVQNRLIRHGEICYQCGKEGHWAKDCLDSSSSSSESWLTVEDLDSDDEPEAFYSQYTETSCTRCGRTNHNISQCYARYSVNGRRLSASGDYENGCSRCGRRNHHVSSCHARYSVNGRRLWVEWACPSFTATYCRLLLSKPTEQMGHGGFEASKLPAFHHQLLKCASYSLFQWTLRRTALAAYISAGTNA